MIEPLDDELRRFVGALREVDRPGEAARAATWAAIDARLAADVAPRRPARLSWPLAAMAAAVLLGLGLAAATAWRGRAEANVEAVHQHAVDPTIHPLEPRSVRAVESPQARSGESLQPGPEESSQPDPGESLQPGSGESASAPESPHPNGPTSADEPRGLERDTGESPPDSRKPARPAQSRRRPADSPSLRPEEVASFQRAQAALAAGRYEDALAALDVHGRRFAAGVFEEERQVSRATALCKLGRVDAARDARRRFLRERPASHLAERMRQICRDDE
ncbi:tetratricopeptide repeat protein [Nannocystis punicea]|uniref:Tetratricopeptide repeat-containing protein n=1 Tax=Nannocystis punicea TaxID=2995304 RepID=A0ABY7GUW8_9BACT|nr:hypothetical protein [Nannocystis poenicansa]WAS90765.1 hypothetical protein O0S08_31645 [Nannocystis poenicansa]